MHELRRCRQRSTQLDARRGVITRDCAAGARRGHQLLRHGNRLPERHVRGIPRPRALLHGGTRRCGGGHEVPAAHRRGDRERRERPAARPRQSRYESAPSRYGPRGPVHLPHVGLAHADRGDHGGLRERRGRRQDAVHRRGEHRGVAAGEGQRHRPRTWLAAVHLRTEPHESAVP